MDYWDKYFGTGSPVFQVPTDEEEMEELRSEKSVKSGKSPEEIRKFSVDESLSDMDRTCLLMSTGQSVQKMCVIEHLPELLRQQQMETLCKVIPKLCDIIPSSSVEVQVTASRVMGELVQQELIPIHIFITSCLNTVLRQLENKDPVISRAWLGTLLASIPVLPKDEVKRRIMTLAVAKGQLSQTVISRQASCCILKEISQRFDSMWLKREVIPLATALCQDVDSSVRELMCQQLFTLATALGPEVSEGCILPELVELLNDEENHVRVCALDTLADLTTLWSEQCQKTQLIPLVQGFCEAANKSDDWVLLEGVAKLLGRLCYEMKSVMSEEQFEWFLKFYCSLCSRCFPGVPDQQQQLSSSAAPMVTVDAQAECRQHCAFNFPAMLLLVGKDSYKSKLSSTFQALAKDGSSKVRRTLACGFHEVVNVLEDRATLVAGIYQALLRDQSEEVLTGLVTHLPEVLKSFGKAFNLTPETRLPGLTEFIGPLLAFDQLASSFRQWRLHCDLLKAFKCLVACMTSDQIYSKFTPLLLKYITGDVVLPVKQTAAYTLCIFIRYNRRQEQRNELVQWIIEECAKGQSCRRRLLFLEMCSNLIELFSRNFFKNHFYDTLLQLAHDPVINIRLQLCQLFPSLKSLLKLPGDRVLLQSLELTVRKLIAQDRDPDVAQAIRTAVTEMDRIEVAMETLTRKTYFESDLSDYQKEMEENALVTAEEKDRKKSEKTLLSTGKKTTGKSTSKSCPSPRENRKSSLTGLTPSASHSPSVIHRTTIKEKSSKPPPVTKTLSAPSSTVDLNPSQTSPAHSPAHRMKHARKNQNPAGEKGSPPAGDKLTLRNSSASSSSGASNGGHSSGSKAGSVARSKDLFVTSPTSSSSKGNTGAKKKPHSYGLEYSNKGKKRT